MILTVLCAPDIDRLLARKATFLLWKLGQTDAEFYVFGDSR